MSRFLSFLAWTSIVLALLMTSPPIAGAQETTLPPPKQNAPAEGSEERGPIEYGGFDYPPEWDPNKPIIVVLDAGTGDVLNTNTGAIFSPTFREVLLEDGTIIDHTTGEVVAVLPDVGLGPVLPTPTTTVAAETEVKAEAEAEAESEPASQPETETETPVDTVPAAPDNGALDAPGPSAEREVGQDTEPIDDDGGLADTLLYPAIGLSAASLLVGAFIALRRGRRAAELSAAKPELGRDEAMATNQLLAGAKDEADIVRILDRAAERQVKASVTLFHATDDGLHRAGDDEPVDGSDLQRVVDTGQKVQTILINDPAFDGVDQAVLALPVIHGGKVQAVLTAHRTADRPFKDADFATIEPIGPALGGALQRTAELGTMSRLAMVDGLTSLGNRRRLDGDLETTLADAVAGDSLLGYAMIDVDHFKTYNDTHGHAAGDEVLRRVAATIARTVRDRDIVYRYGGEEFSMLLPGATLDEAAAVAERVRDAIERQTFPGQDQQPGGSLTISIGVATLGDEVSADIRERADRALYKAKANGRNQVAFG